MMNWHQHLALEMGVFKIISVLIQPTSILTAKALKMLYSRNLCIVPPLMNCTNPRLTVCIAGQGSDMRRVGHDGD